MSGLIRITGILNVGGWGITRVCLGLTGWW